MADEKTLTIPLADVDYTGNNGGVYGFISWYRLEEEILRNGGIKPTEQIAGYRVTEGGIHFCITKKE